MSSVAPEPMSVRSGERLEDQIRALAAPPSRRSSVASTGGVRGVFPPPSSPARPTSPGPDGEAGVAEVPAAERSLFAPAGKKQGPAAEASSGPNSARGGAAALDKEDVPSCRFGAVPPPDAAVCGSVDAAKCHFAMVDKVVYVVGAGAGWEGGIVTFDLAKREWRVLATRGRWPKLDSGGHAVLVLKRRLLVLGEGEAERPAGGEWLYWFDTQLQSWRRQAVPWTRGRSVRPPPTPRTNRTRHVPHPVPIGRAASPTPYQSDALRPC